MRRAATAAAAAAGRAVYARTAPAARCFSGGPDRLFDEELTDVVGPMPVADLMPPALQQYESLLVNVGSGVGCLIKADRPNRSVGIDTGEIVVATATAAIVTEKGTAGLVTCPETGDELEVQHVAMQRRSSFHDVVHIGRTVDDSGCSLIKLTPATRKRYEGYGFPSLAKKLRVRHGDMFVIMPAADGSRLVCNQGRADGLLPHVQIADFGPEEWTPACAGAPCFVAMSGGVDGALKKTRYESSHRASLVRFQGVLTRHDHSRPYNPRTYVACINSTITQPLAISTWNGRAWQSTFKDV